MITRKKTALIVMTTTLVLVMMGFSGTTRALLMGSVSVLSVGTVKAVGQTVTISVNLTKPVGRNPTSLGVHNNYVGTFTVPTLKEWLKALNVKMVRFYVVGKWAYSPGWNVYIGNWDETKKAFINPNWAEFDTHLRGIYDAGAEPIIGTWGVPDGMTLDAVTTFPKPEQFVAFVRLIAQHCKDLGFYPTYWEIWNEAYSKFEVTYEKPDPVKATAYINLFNAAAQAIHEVLPNALCGSDSSNRRTFFDNYFLPYAQGVGFLSFHRYLSYSPTPGTRGYWTNEELLAYTEWPGALYMRKTWYEKRGEWLPVLLTEINLDSATDPRIQQQFGATFHAEQIRTFILKGVGELYTYFCFIGAPGTWAMTSGEPYTQTRYPVYYLYYLLGNHLAVGDILYETLSSDEAVISSLAWVNGENLNLLLINKLNSTVPVTLTGLPNGPAKIQEIDVRDGVAGIHESTVKVTETAMVKITQAGYSVTLVTLTPTLPTF